MHIMSCVTFLSARNSRPFIFLASEKRESRTFNTAAINIVRILRVIIAAIIIIILTIIYVISFFSPLP